MLTPPLRVELNSDLTAIDEADWDQALGNSATRTIFQTKAYQLAWWETLGRGQLLLIAVYKGPQLVALAPLFADQGMVFLVGSGGSDYLDFLGRVDCPDILAKILDAARQATPAFVGFRFYHVMDRSPTVNTLRVAAPGLDLVCFDEGSLDAPNLRFADWPVGQRWPSEKKSLLRHERTLQKQGRLCVEHFRQHHEIEPLLLPFFEQHIARWSGTAFPSLFLDHHQCSFYQRLSQYLSPRGWLRFSRVSLDEEPVAFHFGFLFESTFLWYKPCFDIQRVRQSPGEVLLRSLLLMARAENAKVFDLGLGDEPFKQRFTTQTQRVRTWGLYPRKQHVDALRESRSIE